MAHAPLLRQNTAPVFPNSSGFGGLPQTSMNHAPRASQLSGSTAVAGSTASLSSLASASTASPMNGGPVLATANIINQKADASRSLYQICISLKQRLGQVPGFEPFLEQLDPHDPVDPLWNLFRTGYPLLAIYNSLRPAEELKVEDSGANEAKKSKIAIFKFVQACMKELNVAPAESFVITDLMGNDTSGFVKVTQVVNYVLDLAEQRGYLLQLASYPEEELVDPNAGSQMTYRDHIVKELVDTERKYVQDLENLHDLKKTLEETGLVPGDIIHQIFLNINAILDFQRRFLIRVETTNSMATVNQQWGAPFSTYEDAFDIYQPFISNQRKAAQMANQVFDKIQLSEHPVAADFNTLDGFLLKPMQRLVKYPLLLKDLIKKTENEDTKKDLIAGCEAAERVLQKANEAVNRDLLDEALEDLINRVDDWKNHKVEQFGKLMLHGTYGVITGKNDQEKDYEIYLFEYILLCCKEISPTRNKDKKDKTRSLGPRRNKNARLQLKGRIFMTNVTDIVSLSKPGSHSVQIWWKGDPGVENFTIKFTHEEVMKKWANGLENQRKQNTPRTSSNPENGAAPDFAWTQAQAGALENPYLQQDDDEEEDELGPSTAPAQFPVSSQSRPPSVPRTASSSNLRARAGTGESSISLAGMVRAPPPRFPMPAPPTPLSLQTQNSGAHSPGGWTGDSYFSPVAESPASSRTSTTSGMFSTPNYGISKSGTPQPQWEDNNRYTAPAMPRAPSRDGSSPNPHLMNGRNPRGPSLPAMASSSQAAAQQRSRSYSTPDINGPGMPRTRQPSQGNIPAVPGIPSHLHPGHDNLIPRAQTSSPRNEIPVRAQTNSPGAQRERMHQHSGSLGGTMNHFPSQPVYPRGNTPNPNGNPARVDSAMANSRTASPALGTGTVPVSAVPPPMPTPTPEMPLPTQLKVRVNCETGNYVTLVVAFNITYQSLIDRIDAKLARFTTSSIGKGLLKLRYRDEDGDFVTIESDDDIQIAFMEWREGVRNMYSGGVGEIELFCVGDTS
ncbi:Pleckstrin homology domain-containing protein [Mariannaea sp. PMI_226]|nr:Pleckstrin homology domain-containing protein [Mariannaea sp. PMI_226]